MTIQDLIDELQKQPDKSAPVHVCGGGELESIKSRHARIGIVLIGEDQTSDYMED